MEGKKFAGTGPAEETLLPASRTGPGSERPGTAGARAPGRENKAPTWVLRMEFLDLACFCPPWGRAGC